MTESQKGQIDESLIAKLNDEFDIEITPSDLIPENFSSAKNIFELVKRLEEE